MTTSIDPKFCKALRPEIEKALKELAERFGLSLTVGNMKYDSTMVRASIQFDVVTEEGTAASAVRDWNQLRCLYGLYEVPFGFTFKTHQGEFSVCGIRPRAQKFPILAKRADGSVFTFKAETVARLFSAVKK